MSVTVLLDHVRVDNAQTVVDIQVTIKAGCLITELHFDRYMRRSNRIENKKTKSPIGTEALVRGVMLANPNRLRALATALHVPFIFSWKIILSRDLRT